MVQLVTVQLGSSRLVLELGVAGVAIVLAEKGRSIGVAAKLHLTELLPWPIVVQLGRLDESEMDAKATVDSGAIYTYENSVGHAGPCGIFRVAIEANLVCRHGS